MVFHVQNATVSSEEKLLICNVKSNKSYTIRKRMIPAFSYFALLGTLIFGYYDDAF